MRLLQLHLRNIASIEKADIDFVNEPKLQDPDSGRQARMFLIYGDTGTGKTVLLDAIAMALFGQTPRIEGVANKLRNTFTTSWGSEISISSIEQYTRLGITDKDECYSEVLFEGNDGRRYRARMQLGVTRSQKSRKKWLLQIDDEPEIQGFTQCGEAIQKAIGMNFAQFSRMAMLAQGQFATFLCGDREERADILEKLTNTTIFTRYGAAVKSIHDRKRAAAEGAKKAFEEAGKYVLEEAQREELLKQQIEAGKEVETTRPERDRMSEHLAKVKKLEELEVRRSKTSDRLKELLSQQEGETYKAAMRLFTEWDATETERAALERLINGRRRIEETQREEVVLKATYADLLSDLRWREGELSRKRDVLSADAEWLEQRRGNEELYRNSGAVCEQLKSLRRMEETLKTLQKEKTQCEEQRTVLAERHKAATVEQEKAAAAVEAGQKGIEALTTSLQALQPECLQKELEDNDRRYNSFVRLRDEYSAWLAKVEDLKDKRARQESLEGERTNAEKTCSEAEVQQRQDQQRYEQSLSRYTTLSASLDEKLEDLRRQLSSERGDICPLCGQPVGEALLTRDQFANLVSPLERERDEAERTAASSRRAYIAARDAVSSIDGQIKSLATETARLTPVIEEERAKLDARMLTDGIVFDNSATEVIASEVSVLEGKLDSLHRRLQETEHLRTTLTEKQEAMRRLVEAKGKADLAVQDAALAVRHNEERINVYVADIQLYHQEQETAFESLHLSLDRWMEAWKEDTVTAEQELKRQADEYHTRRKSYDEASTSLREAQSLHAHLETLCAALRQLQPGWPTSVEPHEHTIDDPLHRWTTLSQRCSALAETVGSCRQTIAESQSLLDGWYAAHESDEAYLAALAGRRTDIPEARRIVAAIDTDIAKCRQTEADTIADILQTRQQLGLATEAPIPDRMGLEAQVAEINGRLEEAQTRVAALRSRLQTDADNRRKYEEARAAYERAQAEYDHWSVLNQRFGGDRFRNLVQTHILHPLLANANVYLSHITERYSLTCSEDNEQLAILVLDRYNRNEVRSAAVLSGGERFMISLALSLALSSLNRADMNVDILFIDEGFGTLDQECLDAVMKTLGRLAEFTGQSNRRVGIISHREELLDCIPNKIKLRRVGEGRSSVEVVCD